jgi:hypothetical protein
MLTPCPACGRFVRRASSCPDCAAPLRPGVTAAALLLGLAACSGETTKSDSATDSQPELHTGSTQMDYGVPSTYESADTGN